MNEATLMTLRAEFLADTSTKRLGFTGARCELPNGQVVETKGRRTPLYDLARKLEAMGFGDRTLQANTPTGTPSLRGKVSVMAGLTVEENDKSGLRLRKFRPVPVGGFAKDAHLGPEGTQPPEKGETSLSESPDTGRAALG
jgi:hypothetical protein